MRLICHLPRRLQELSEFIKRPVSDLLFMIERGQTRQKMFFLGDVVLMRGTCATQNAERSFSLFFIRTAQGMHQDQRVFTFPKVAQSLLPVLTRAALQVQNVVLDLKGRTQRRRK